MKSSSARSFVLGLAALVLAAASCAPDREESEMAKAPSWETRFQELLPALGHRNWIVVADSAFPLQISPGMEVIASGEDLLPVLDKVLAAVDKSRHLRPKIYLDEELAYVTDELKPGARAIRQQLESRLKGREVTPVLHEELIARMDAIAKTFKILMIKTNLAIPYTSVFLDLDCGYWPAASEAGMREAMKVKK